MLTTIERVLALQKSPIFAEIPTDGLAHLAAIAEEAEFRSGDILFEEGGVPEACYLILAGSVELRRGGAAALTVGVGEDLGIWALLDGEPHVYAARALDNTHALRIAQDDFYDLLADHTEIIQTLFRTLVRRIRGVLAERVA